jgi:hypothetical protein
MPYAITRRPSDDTVVIEVSVGEIPEATGLVATVNVSRDGAVVANYSYRTMGGVEFHNLGTKTLEEDIPVKRGKSNMLYQSSEGWNEKDKFLLNYVDENEKDILSKSQDVAEDYISEVKERLSSTEYIEL